MEFAVQTLLILFNSMHMINSDIFIGEQALTLLYTICLLSIQLKIADKQNQGRFKFKT